MTIAESLKRFRKDYNLTQKQVANSIHVLTPSYQRYEYGTVPPTTVVIKIADAFNVSIDYLVGRSDNPQRF